MPEVYYFRKISDRYGATLVMDLNRQKTGTQKNFVYIDFFEIFGQIVKIVVFRLETVKNYS